MSVTDISLTVKGEKRLLQKMERIRKRMPNLSEPNKAVGVLLDSWVQRNFKTEGGNVGGWAPLKAGGRKKKGKALNVTARILQDTGVLRASFVSFSDKKSAGIGSELPYSKFHEIGTKHIPIRRMLPKNRDVEKQIKRLYTGHVQEVLDE